jgi:hypothetical protein
MSSRLVWLGLIAASSAACAVDPLSSEQLYGPLGGDVIDAAADVRVAQSDTEPPPDIAAPDLASAEVAGAEVAAPDVSPPDVEDVVCDADNLNGSVSGVVLDACTGKTLDSVQVGVGGKHICAFQLKGSWDISGLPVGCDKTLTSGRPGFKPYMSTIHLERNGNPGITIRLEREATCDPTTPPPPAPACMCSEPGCVRP